MKSNYGEGVFLPVKIQQVACDQSEVEQGEVIKSFLCQRRRIVKVTTDMPKPGASMEIHYHKFKALAVLWFGFDFLFLFFVYVCVFSTLYEAIILTNGDSS